MAERYEFIKIDPFSDFRGRLKKVFIRKMLAQGSNVGEVYVLHTKTGCVRGNHYHKRNIEYFTVLCGTATIALKDICMNDAIVVRVSAGDDIVIKVPEMVAHGFRNDEEEELVILAVATEEYDPVDKDTYTFKLL